MPLSEKELDLATYLFRRILEECFNGSKVNSDQRPEPLIPTQEKSNFLSAYEIAGFLGVSKSKVYELAKQGKIPVVMIGKRMRFRLDDIERTFMANKDSGT